MQLLFLFGHTSCRLEQSMGGRGPNRLKRNYSAEDDELLLTQGPQLLALPVRKWRSFCAARFTNRDPRTVRRYLATLLVRHRTCMTGSPTHAEQKQAAAPVLSSVVMRPQRRSSCEGVSRPVPLTFASTAQDLLLMNEAALFDVTKSSLNLLHVRWAELSNAVAEGNPDGIREQISSLLFAKARAILLVDRSIQEATRLVNAASMADLNADRLSTGGNCGAIRTTPACTTTYNTQNMLGLNYELKYRSEYE